MPIQLSIQELTKRFKTGDGVKGISLDVMKGELVTLLGPSGCGKTTVLRSIGGFWTRTVATFRFRVKAYSSCRPKNVRRLWCSKAIICGRI